jgi:3,4-dihydroxy 2-butanone 4-phosphate synthase / GTP cyclohydrolase II
VTAIAPAAPGAAGPFADGELVLVGDPGDPVVFLALAAVRVDAGNLDRLQELAGGMTVLGLAEGCADRLGLETLPLGEGRSPEGLQLAAPVDAATGIRGGWSARDRAYTIRVCADPASRAEDIAVPGHVHTARLGSATTPAAAAALELAREAGPSPAVVLAAVSDRTGAPATLDRARSLAALRSLPHVSSSQLRGEALARRAGATIDCELPTRDGDFRAIALDDAVLGDHDRGSVVALVHGDPAARSEPLVHVHAACLLGDALGSLRCDCRARLHTARAEILAAGAGMIVYVKPGSADAARRYHCGAEAPIDLAPVIGLLHAYGIDHRAALATR